MMTRIGIITDIHANLPALRACLHALEDRGCDLIVHTGDAIGIGPRPAECLAIMLAHPKLVCVSGNHETMFVKGLGDPPPKGMSPEEIRHHHWTHDQLSDDRKAELAGWPYELTEVCDGVRTSFLHYGLRETRRTFVGIAKEPGPPDLDRVFARQDAELIFYGHYHPHSDITGRTRYVNPGSLGCHTESTARFCVAQFQNGQCEVELASVPYDDSGLYQDFEQRRVPDRQLIYRAFFGGRFVAGR